MSPALRESIETLYHVFARYDRPAVVHGFSTCITPAGLEKLVSTKLRQLSGDALGSYAFSAVSTIGSLLDFKYFLPRIVELTVGELRHGYFQCGDTDAEIVFGKMPYGDWRTWPAAEQAATENVALLWLESCFAGDFAERPELESQRLVSDWWPIQTAMQSCLILGLDLRPRLRGFRDQARRNPTSPFARSFALWLMEIEGKDWLDGSVVSDAYLSKRDQPRKLELQDFLKSAGLREVFERAFFAAGESQEKELFSDALQRAEWFGCS